MTGMDDDAYKDLDVFVVQEKVTTDKVDDNVIWKRVKISPKYIDWEGKKNCLGCIHEKHCPVQHRSDIDRKKRRLFGVKDECPYSFWEGFVPFIQHYNMRNAYLGRTAIPIPSKYFTRWSFRHEVDIYHDIISNFFEIFLVFWWIIKSYIFHVRWKWGDYWVVRTRKTVFTGFVVGLVVGFILSSIILYLLFGGWHV